MRVHAFPRRGFTLIELMIGVAIVSILAAIAIPSYRDYVRKSRRADGWALLQNAALAQEKWRVSNTTYSSSVNNLAGVCPTSGTCTSGNGLYTLSITGGSATASGYTLVATAVTGSSQASDTGCLTMTFAQTSTGQSQTPAACWKK